MTIELIRTQTNRLYTEGRLVVNGEQFCHSVECTRDMLPVGSYPVSLSPGRRRRLIEVEGRQITHGNTWRDAEADHAIIIGQPGIPGAVLRSPHYYELLFDRIEKCKTPVVLHVVAPDCREGRPSAFWTTPHGGIPPGVHAPRA